MTWAGDLKVGHCSTPGFAAPSGLGSVRLGPAEVAHAAMTAASIVDLWAHLPAAVRAVEAAASRGDATKSTFLAQFAQYERTDADAHQEPLAGSLASLTFAMPGGNGDGLRL